MKTGSPHQEQAIKKGACKLLQRIRRHREHRRELKRARKAAQSVFSTRPRMSSRKRAALMLGAGAMGVGAFTLPVGMGDPSVAQGDLSGFENPVQTLRQSATELNASDDFKQALIEEEGVRYTVYRDVAGYPTVGVGHLVRPQDGLSVGDTITDEQVLNFLNADLASAEQDVRTLVGDLPLYQYEFDALLDLVYNVGPGNVSESESPRLNAAIADRDYDALANELEYRHAGGKVANGLTYRSERRTNMFTEGNYDDPRQS